MEAKHRNTIYNTINRLDIDQDVKITKIPHSTSTHNYIVESDNNKIMARMYAEHASPRLEYKIFSNVKKSIPVPKPIQYFSSEESGELPVFYMEFIKGPILGEQIQENQHKWLRSYIEVLAKIHKINWQEDLSEIKFVTYKKAHGFNKGLVKRRRKMSKQHKVKKEVKPVIKWMKNHRKDTKTEQLYFLHSDYHPFNVLIDDDTDELRIVDWEGIELGDNRYDLALAILALEPFVPQDELDTLIDHYASFGLPTEALDFYYVAAALSRVIKLYRFLQPDFPQYELYKKIFDSFRDKIISITGKGLPLFID